MKKSMLTSLMLALTWMFGLLFTNLYAHNMPPEAAPCENLSEFFKKEYRTGKTEDNSRIIGLKKEDALSKAVGICIRLKGKQIPSDGDDLVYELPDGLGRIIIQEVFKDGIYTRLTLDTGCNNLPFTELRLVSLHYYNSK